MFGLELSLNYVIPALVILVTGLWLMRSRDD